jgi:hypothetical protein
MQPWRSPPIIKEIYDYLAAEQEAEPVADDLLVKMFEALEAGVPISPNSVFHDWIKKRLSDSKIDPIGWVNKERNLLSWDKLYEDMEPLYLHPPKPEPKPELTINPVAWTNQDELNTLGTDVTCYMYLEPMAGENNIPLYTKPEPKRKPMKIEEIGEAWEARGNLSKAGLVSFARAIEKHHGIGDEE